MYVRDCVQVRYRHIRHLFGVSHLPLWRNWLERLPCNAVVAGSKPAGFFYFFGLKCCNYFFFIYFY